MSDEHLSAAELAEIESLIREASRNRIRVLVQHIGQTGDRCTTVTRYKTTTGIVCEVLDMGSTIPEGIELEGFVARVPMDGKTYRGAA